MDSFALYLFGIIAIGSTIQALDYAKKQKMFLALFFALWAISLALAFGIGISPLIPPKVLIYILSR
jgi:hypothetical protein